MNKYNPLIWIYSLILHYVRRNFCRICHTSPSNERKQTGLCDSVADWQRPLWREDCTAAETGTAAL